MGFIISIIDLAVWIMMLAIFGSVVLSWLRAFRVNVPRYNTFVRLIEDTAELMLAPLRRSLPVSGGGFDFSPMVAILILVIIQRLLHALLRM